MTKSLVRFSTILFFLLHLYQAESPTNTEPPTDAEPDTDAELCIYVGTTGDLEIALPGSNFSDGCNDCTCDDADGTIECTTHNHCIMEMCKAKISDATGWVPIDTEVVDGCSRCVCLKGQDSNSPTLQSCNNECDV